MNALNHCIRDGLGTVHMAFLVCTNADALAKQL